MGEIDKELLFNEYKLAVETQMHFNDMMWKMRSALLTAIFAVFTLAVSFGSGPATGTQQSSNSSSSSTSVAVPVDNGDLTNNAPNTYAARKAVWAGIALLLAVLFMDIPYFYRMLLGAVKRSEVLEGHAKKAGFELNLTGSISKKTPRWLAHLSVFLFYFTPFAAMVAYLLWFS